MPGRPMPVVLSHGSMSAASMLSGPVAVNRSSQAVARPFQRATKSPAVKVSPASRPPASVPLASKVASPAGSWPRGRTGRP